MPLCCRCYNLLRACNYLSFLLIFVARASFILLPFLLVITCIRLFVIIWHVVFITILTLPGNSGSLPPLSRDASKIKEKYGGFEVITPRLQAICPLYSNSDASSEALLELWSCQFLGFVSEVNRML